MFTAVPDDVEQALSRKLDLHIDILGFRKHSDRRCGGVDTTTAFGRGHALDSMHAAFELQLGKHADAAD